MTILSIIIVNYNTAGLLSVCLESIIKNGQKQIENGEWELIVIDNYSTDNSINTVKKYREIKLIKNSENLGFGKANNQGIRQAKGKYILLLNSDIVVLEKGIEKLLNFYISINKNIFIGGKLLNKDGSPQPSAGPFFSLFNAFLMLFCRGDSFGLTRYSPQNISRVDWVSGACLMGTKNNFEKTGLFDEKIFMYMEEVDFLYRAKRLGLETIFYPDAVFMHEGCGSSKGKSLPVLNIYKGLIFFYDKYFPFWQRRILKIMLQLKALLGITIGNLSGSNYLKKTYEEAFTLVK